MKLLLARHGHVEGVDPPRFRGRTELPLTARGRDQARALAERLLCGPRPAAIYCSPLGRCVETASMIATAFGMNATELPELIDIDFGDCQGRAFTDIAKERPDIYRSWLSDPDRVRFPQGDALQDLAVRINDALRFFIGKHRGNTIVAVGHDSTNRVLLTEALAMPLNSYWRFSQDPCCLNEIDFDDGRRTIRRVNDTAHLEEGLRSQSRKISEKSPSTSA
jgi:probable phosphoglycerate mutase